MILTQTFPVGPLSTNCYLISLNKKGILIDPGEDGDFLSEQIIHKNLDLQAILLTHGHFDHVLGLLSLHLNFPSVPIYLHSADHFLYKQAVSSAKHWVGDSYFPDPLPDSQGLSSTGDLAESQVGTAKLGGESLLSHLITIPTPGHTLGLVCFHLPEHKLLFSGDMLFKSAVGRTDLSYSDPDALQTSLKTLSQLPPDTIVYPGHGDLTTIRDEFKKT